MSKIINLTPHPVEVLDGSKCTYDKNSRKYRVEGVIVPTVTYPKQEGIVYPRCTQREVVVGNINGIEVYRMEFGEVENLPEPQEDTYYIVALMVAKACPNRHDLLIPAHQVVLEDGRTAGCLSWAIV